MGVLTPQANTTVEAEFRVLLPQNWAMLNARLMSEKSTISERLRDYNDRYEESVDQFANAPVDVLAAACTGASYLIGADVEARMVSRLEAAFGVPFITAALASVAALRAMGARRIAVLSPYPEELNALSASYWEAHGFEVVAKSGPVLDDTAFHAIYAMQDAAVVSAYRRLSEADADAVLMLGTGMPSMRPILIGHDAGWTPALSCNLALVWASVQKRRWEDLQDADIGVWCAGLNWRQAMDLMFPEPLGKP